ncbi:hypothetical protein [Bacteriovorax sp. DB6_IX]|uniref:hypothetical protein n=1 Tax=Bacteriovorax sp. DB6_IX TaxID=1353530 RepID=UPI000389DC0B|nr:hypothetical protein [Bacteriovorax sp. DB6_IX]EQC50948.1 hypothetical protein M901_1173 [Bacteriovorax sp. DB6_IX]
MSVKAIDQKYEFAFMDFLTYIAPGSILLYFIFGSLLYTDKLKFNAIVSSSLGQGLIYFTVYLVLAYLLGIFSSSLAVKLHRFRSEKNYVFLNEFDFLNDKLKQLMPILNTDMKDRDYLFLVRNRCYNINAQSYFRSRRQNTIRQFKRNSAIAIILSILISSFLIGITDLKLFYNPLVLSIYFSSLVISFVFFDAEIRHRKNEFREVATGVISSVDISPQ